jgi:hypothetical protein
MAKWLIQNFREAAEVADEVMRRDRELMIELAIHADSIRIKGKHNGRHYARIVHWNEIEASTFNVLTANIRHVVTKLNARDDKAL